MRERDSMEQVRLPIADLVSWFEGNLTYPKAEVCFYKYIRQEFFMKKYVYMFTEGDARMRNLLGERG